MITRLHVRNFKSLRDVDLEFGPLSVLVGPNMSGKSNILDALRFLWEVFFPQGSSDGLGSAIARRGGLDETVWKGETRLVDKVKAGTHDKLIAVSVEACDPADPNSQYKYELQLIGGPGQFLTTQNESLKLVSVDEEYDLIVRVQGFAQYKNRDGTMLGGVGSTNVSAIQYGAPNWDGYRFRELVRDWRFYHLVPPDMKESSLVSSGKSLESHGQNLSAWLMWLQTHSPEHFERISEVLHDLFPDLIRINAIPTSEGKVYLAAREKGLKHPINLWQMSDGFLVLTALLSLIYVPAELAGTLFCIEEPENHMHPRLLETLVALLRQVRHEVRDSKQSPTQTIITTQSPYLVNQFSLDEVIWVEKKNGETKVFRPSNKAQLKKLVEDKELGLGDLMYTGALGDEK
jgi:predicted ATPase